MNINSFINDDNSIFKSTKLINYNFKQTKIIKKIIWVTIPFKFFFSEKKLIYLFLFIPIIQENKFFTDFFTKRVLKINEQKYHIFR